ncbi:MAG: hypothetical protein AABZ15_05190 [Nitrospirota bacterium]
MPDMPKGKAGLDDQEHCLDISLQTVDSRMLASSGREISFTRAVLTVRNVCDAELSMVPHATLGQEGGTVQDVSGAFPGNAGVAIPPGGTVSGDVYDLLLPAHSGTASKVHMFGYRAALNWRFDLAAWAEYRRAAESPPVRTSISRWTLRWSVPDAATGAVVLTIEEGEGQTLGR